MPTIDINGTEIFYTDEGPRDAPAMVLSHSLFFDHTMFDHQVDFFEDRMRVIRYDHRGQGRSDPAEMHSVDMDTLTEDAAELIKALEVAPCLFVGNSMGGFVALRLAARMPELLTGCVVLGTSAKEEHKLEEFAPLVEAMGAHGAEPVIDALMHIMFGDTIVADAERADLVAHWKTKMLDLDKNIARSAHGVIHRDSVLEELEHAHVPILVLAGREDHAYEVPLSEHIAESAPQAIMQIVPNAGHSVALEEHAVANDYIASFAETLRT